MGWECFMTASEEPSAASYRKMAKEAENNAKKIPPGNLRDGFFRLAAGWGELAREAKKNER